MNAISTLMKRHWHLLVFILGLVFVFWLTWSLRNVLLPFIVGLILASLMLPIIRWVEKRLPGAGKKPKRKQLKRISIIVIVYFLSLVVLGLLIFYSINLIGKAMGTLTQDAAQILPNGLYTIKQWLKSIPFLSSPAIQMQMDSLALQAGEALPGVINDFLTSSIKNAQSSVGMILGFVIMPIFIFFLLKDWDNLRDTFFKFLPEWTGKYLKGTLAILQHVVMRYIRGQLLLAAAVGICAGILLGVLRIEFAIPLAVFAGLTEMVPMIGPWLGGGLAVIVTLATAPEKFIWVGMGFLIIQLLENNLLVPKIQGSQMEIHPAFIIVLSVLGAYFAGIIGFIIVLPVTMFVLNLFKYFRETVRNRDIAKIDA
ncbi:MAG: AI-2E family transporter [Dehalococcoidales bacterium]|jgi:predicted PurR-regulated permease PerM|nr:AI-2E family transporter [Dehalococcoidales bacterium]